ERCLEDKDAQNMAVADLLATLTEFTARSIVQEYRRFLPQMPDEVLVCGGGSRNAYLRSRLAVTLDGPRVLTTDDVGLSADAKEAIAFAVLAHWYQLGIPGNLPVVTGASQGVVLGRYFSPG
ncbi:MAG: anhydro-N-acetylmuramic acid kinase, partial [Cyanobacteria bacterium P01_F01_bin.42]